MSPSTRSYMWMIVFSVIAGVLVMRSQYGPAIIVFVAAVRYGVERAIRAAKEQT